MSVIMMYWYAKFNLEVTFDT